MVINVTDGVIKRKLNEPSAVFVQKMETYTGKTTQIDQPD